MGVKGRLLQDPLGLQQPRESMSRGSDQGAHFQMHFYERRELSRIDQKDINLVNLQLIDRGLRDVMGKITYGKHCGMLLDM